MPATAVESKRPSQRASLVKRSRSIIGVAESPEPGEKPPGWSRLYQQENAATDPWHHDSFARHALTALEPRP
jgi:hypothetical protein